MAKLILKATNGDVGGRKYQRGDVIAVLEDSQSLGRVDLALVGAGHWYVVHLPGVRRSVVKDLVKRERVADDGSGEPGYGDSIRHKTIDLSLSFTSEERVALARDGSIDTTEAKVRSGETTRGR